MRPTTSIDRHVSKLDVLQISKRNLAMLAISRFATSSLLVLLAATLTTAAYARGGGHSGTHGSSNPSLHSSSSVHSISVRSTTAHSRKAIVSGHSGKKLPKGSVALGGGSHQPSKPVVREHCSLGQICNSCPNCTPEGGLGWGEVPAPDQSHQTGGGGHVNDHRTVVHDHRSGG
jgi:hypothetical protein